jgi:hypothetical protein
MAAKIISRSESKFSSIIKNRIQRERNKEINIGIEATDL